jgi:hypothetical protein
MKRVGSAGFFHREGATARISASQETESLRLRVFAVRKTFQNDDLTRFIFYSIKPVKIEYRILNIEYRMSKCDMSFVSYWD